MLIKKDALYHVISENSGVYVLTIRASDENAHLLERIAELPVRLEEVTPVVKFHYHEGRR